MSEQEYQSRKEQAQWSYQEYRQAGGTNCLLDWLWENNPTLMGEIQGRWRFQSSYTCLGGGVMFCPKPMRRRR